MKGGATALNGRGQDRAVNAPFTSRARQIGINLVEYVHFFSRLGCNNRYFGKYVESAIILYVMKFSRKAEMFYLPFFS
jgi:hypothetical protein